MKLKHDDIERYSEKGRSTIISECREKHVNLKDATDEAVVQFLENVGVRFALGEIDM